MHIKAKSYDELLTSPLCMKMHCYPANPFMAVYLQPGLVLVNDGGESNGVYLVAYMDEYGITAMKLLGSLRSPLFMDLIGFFDVQKLDTVLAAAEGLSPGTSSQVENLGTYYLYLHRGEVDSDLDTAMAVRNDNEQIDNRRKSDYQSLVGLDVLKPITPTPYYGSCGCDQFTTYYSALGTRDVQDGQPGNFGTHIVRGIVRALAVPDSRERLLYISIDPARFPTSAMYYFAEQYAHLRSGNRLELPLGILRGDEIVSTARIPPFATRKLLEALRSGSEIFLPIILPECPDTLPPPPPEYSPACAVL